MHEVAPAFACRVDDRELVQSPRCMCELWIAKDNSRPMHRTETSTRAHSKEIQSCLTNERQHRTAK
jgi:hypothetical protein